MQSINFSLVQQPYVPEETSPPTMYWSPNLLVVVFKKQEISQQVVTRMQDLASESSKKFSGGDAPGPSQREATTPSCIQHPARFLAGLGPGVGTQTLRQKLRGTSQPWLRPRLWVHSQQFSPVTPPPKSLTFLMLLLKICRCRCCCTRRNKNDVERARAGGGERVYVWTMNSAVNV